MVINAIYYYQDIEKYHVDLRDDTVLQHHIQNRELKSISDYEQELRFLWLTDPERTHETKQNIYDMGEVERKNKYWIWTQNQFRDCQVTNSRF